MLTQGSESSPQKHERMKPGTFMHRDKRDMHNVVQPQKVDLQMLGGSPPQANVY